MKTLRIMAMVFSGIAQTLENPNEGQAYCWKVSS